jgi:hypothetical protein
MDAAKELGVPPWELADETPTAEVKTRWYIRAAYRARLGI